jgi:hypothetical protein
MRVVIPGERYAISTAQNVEVLELIFCKSENGKFIDGLTNEEVLEVLIHRMECMVKEKPSQENMNTLTHLNQAKGWLNIRNLNKLKKQRSNDNRRTGIHFQAEGR